MYIGKDEDGKSWWMFDDRLKKYIAAVDLELNITFEETCESELNFEDTLDSYYHRDWYYLTKSKPMESKYKNVWQRSLTISGIRMKNTTENIMRLYFGGGYLTFLNVLKVEGEEVDVRRCKWHV